MGRQHPNYPGPTGTDARLAERRRSQSEINARARAIQVLERAGVPFVVGGAYCFAHYTGIYRDTKDLDLFPRRQDALWALEILARDGWRTERTDDVWLYKAFRGDYYIDLIFSSGNGVAEVDDLWFAHARRGTVFGQPVWLAPPEELIWSKAFVLERERFDGSDVIHLLQAAGRRMDWERLLRRFERHWEVLLSHVLLFRFCYPGERDAVPDWVMADLLHRTAATVREGPLPLKVCRGNLLSKVNFRVDLREWGYLDGRRWDELQRMTENGRGAGSEREAEDRGGG